jgi:hypothetical protein
MTQQQIRKITQKYFEKNGGIDEVFNNIDKKNEYEKFLTKLLNAKLVKGKRVSISWKQKRAKR